MRLAAAAAAIVAGTWHTAPPLHSARAAHAVVTANSSIYVLGGSNGQLDVERFDGKTWRVATQLPYGALNAPAAATLDGRIYVTGGFEAQTNLPTSAVEIYDPTANAWSDGPPLPAPRGGHAAVVLDGKIHLLGGGNSQSTLADHTVFDPATQTWSEAAPLPRSEGSVAAVVFHGTLYAIGGRSGPSDYGDVYRTTHRTTVDARAFDPAARDGRRGRLQGRDLLHRRRVAGLRTRARRRLPVRARLEEMGQGEEAADAAQLRARGRLPELDLRRRRQPGRRREPFRRGQPRRRAVSLARRRRSSRACAGRRSSCAPERRRCAPAPSPTTTRAHELLLRRRRIDLERSRTLPFTCTTSSYVSTSSCDRRRPATATPTTARAPTPATAPPRDAVRTAGSARRQSPPRTAPGIGSARARQLVQQLDHRGDTGDRADARTGRSPVSGACAPWTGPPPGGRSSAG